MLNCLLKESRLHEFQSSILICRSLSKYSSATIQRPFILKPRRATAKKNPRMVLLPTRRKARLHKLKASPHPNNRRPGNRRNMRPNTLHFDEVPQTIALPLILSLWNTLFSNSSVLVTPTFPCFCG